MTADQIGNLADVAIPAVIGAVLLLTRGRMVAKVSDPQKRARSAKLLGFAGPILLVSALLIGFGVFTGGKKADALADAVSIINAKAPRMLDEATRLEGATAEEGRRLLCRLTLTTYASTAIDKKVWQEQVVPMLRKNAEASPAVQAAKKENITTIYRYSGSDGIVIGDITIEPDKK